MILLSVLLKTGAQEPVVENVRFEQRTDGSLLVDIWYDVSTAGGLPLIIKVDASDDHGASWNLPCSSVTGDVGDSIIAGQDKHVVWDFFADHPNTSGTDYRIRVSADDHVLTDIDGNHYQTVRIGNQIWMAENLRVAHYRNGDAIPPLARGIGPTLIPRPEKFYFAFGDPIDTTRFKGRHDDQSTLFALRAEVQEALSAQLKILVNIFSQANHYGILRKILTRL